MTALQQLRGAGQSVWLDHITRTLIDDGTLARYIGEYSVTGLTSNPSIFDAAIGGSDAYDQDIRTGARDGLCGEALFTELALADLRRAADLFRPCFEATDRQDGWVSMEVSPLLATDTGLTISAARQIHDRAARDNLFVKIPGTPEGLPAIEEVVSAGIPVNVTLLFSCAQYMAANAACLRGIERRVAAGLDPSVATVASLFVSRWDVAANPLLPVPLRNRLGIAVAGQTWYASCAALAAPRWQAAIAAGARAQRPLWASTGSKDPSAPDTLYVDALVAPDSINTLPEKTLLAFADHGRPQPAMAVDGAGGDRSDATIASIRQAGVDTDALALRLQQEGVASFVRSWRQLLQRIEHKSGAAHCAPAS
jgi:transaldolase